MSQTSACPQQAAVTRPLLKLAQAVGEVTACSHRITYQKGFIWVLAWPERTPAGFPWASLLQCPELSRLTPRQQRQALRLFHLLSWAHIAYTKVSKPLLVSLPQGCPRIVSCSTNKALGSCSYDLSQKAQKAHLQEALSVYRLPVPPHKSIGSENNPVLPRRSQWLEIATLVNWETI